MKKSELLERLTDYPDDAELIPRHNSYLHRSWLIVKFDGTTECIIMR